MFWTYSSMLYSIYMQDQEKKSEANYMSVNDYSKFPERRLVDQDALIWEELDINQDAMILGEELDTSQHALIRKNWT